MQLIIIAINILLGFITLHYASAKHISKIFSGLVAAISIWMIGLIMVRQLDGVIGLRIAFFGASLIMPFFFLFTASFPIVFKKKFIVFFKYFIIIFGLVFAFLSLFTGLVVENVTLTSPAQYTADYGFFYSIFGLVFIVGVIGAIVLMVYQYVKAKGRESQQALYELIGMTFAIIPATFSNLIIPLFTGNSFYSNFGPFAVTIFIGFSFYAIIKHRLMDIRFVLRRYSVYLVSLISIILPVVIVKRLFNCTYGLNAVWLDYIFLIIAISLFPALRNYYYCLANRYFFTSLYDAQQVIAGLSDKLSSTLRLDKIYKYVSDSLIASLHARSIQIYIFNKKSKKYEPSYYHGNEKIDQNVFVEDRGFYFNYLQKNVPVIVDELRKKAYVSYRQTIDHLTSQKVEVVIPLYLKDRTIGIIALGRKESHDVYNDEDIKLLETIGAQSAIAIDNAINYEEVKNFSKKLQYEVKIATDDLVKANAKLKQLDQAKSEFVSIASHQLRTPLTVIKGYISMFLEGSFGKMDELQKDSMEKVYHSNERLIQLVENLLNISRIESGRFCVNKEPVNLFEMVKSVVEELSGPANKKSFKLELVKPKKDVIVVPLDQEKIRQVVLNLIDNSIKYTKKGTVKVRISRRKNNVLFCVSDKGMGIKPDDLVDLFEKFFRGTDTALIHTEGIGLGLYVAKRIVEVHGGKIWAESKGENKGSKFCFTLPLKDKDKNK
ncbi:MAG: ATP-binding protein [Patescibacteria group bacterium]|nr:ATP-binding protein [Patescibacteria group bacterium]